VILNVELPHVGVAGSLRQHRGGRDAQAVHVTFHQRGL
jgi:hypothetical protein